MATFSISLSVNVEAENLEEALDIQARLFADIAQRTPEVIDGPYEIDVEQTDGFEDDGQPDEAQEWESFDPDC